MNQLISIYYALFHSIATQGLIAWDAAYNTHINKVTNLQKRILKIFINQNFDKSKVPLNIRQTFLLECVTNQYKYLKDIFTNNSTRSRFKNTNLPINDLEIGRKNFSYAAYKIFNKLPIKTV